MCDTDVCSLYKICAVIECVTHGCFPVSEKGSKNSNILLKNDEFWVTLRCISSGSSFLESGGKSFWDIRLQLSLWLLPRRMTGERSFYWLFTEFLRKLWITLKRAFALESSRFVNTVTDRSLYKLEGLFVLLSDYLLFISRY